uniref:Uncharacterized protein n=1 Tax=Physcomitrium patens TaxID=3218 RepID=A0A2K1JCT6_PHYPA|nr:hypothetical protein PHYPA_019623 [Physcomitrium patens]
MLYHRGQKVSDRLAARVCVGRNWEIVFASGIDPESRMEKDSCIFFSRKVTTLVKR